MHFSLGHSREGADLDGHLSAYGNSTGNSTGNPTTTAPRLNPGELDAGRSSLENNWSGLAGGDQIAAEEVAFPQESESANQVEAAFRRELGRHPHFRGRCDWVQARFAQGTLRLGGTLPTFYLKQLAQAIAHRLPSVVRVVNRIEVHNLVSGNLRLETWKVS
jgi:osmotically-inducible protein OsmY